MAKTEHYLDRLKFILTDARKVSPYLTKELKLSEGVANRILNKQREADERLLRPLYYFENSSATWVMYSKGDPFLVERPNTTAEADEYVRTLAHDEPDHWRLTVVSGGGLTALVLDQPVTYDCRADFGVKFECRQIEVVGGAATFGLAQVLVASELPLRSTRLATLDPNLVKQIRDGQAGTFRMFGSATFGTEGWLTHAGEFPQDFRLAAQTRSHYSAKKAAGHKPRTKK